MAVVIVRGMQSEEWQLPNNIIVILNIWNYVKRDFC